MAASINTWAAYLAGTMPQQVAERDLAAVHQQYAAAAAAKGMEVDEQHDQASNRKRKQDTFAVEAQGAMLMQVQMQQQVAQAPTQSPQVLHAPFQQPQAPGGAKRLRS